MRAFLLIMDSVGIGGAPDAAAFGDQGSNTILHIAERQRGLNVPHLAALGFGDACALAGGVQPPGIGPVASAAYWGAAREVSAGKDTPSGHWELAGVPVETDWGYFTPKENSFPPELLARIVERAELPGFLGNCHASGTDIIAALGTESIASGKPIFYTSADSVFQIAAHEESFGLENLHRLCLIAREEVDRYNIGRVIARPFAGEGTYKRTPNRRDYAVPPPAPTLLQQLVDAGGTVIAIGKIADIYAHTGISQSIKAFGLPALWDATLQAAREAADNSLIVTNFVDFDQEYGHRRDVPGYAQALEYFDSRLPELDAILKPGDLALITADHGCDPTWPGTEHTREQVPVLAWGPGLHGGGIGSRESFADIGQSLAAWLKLGPTKAGRSFL